MRPRFENSRRLRSPCDGGVKWLGRLVSFFRIQRAETKVTRQVSPSRRIAPPSRSFLFLLSIFEISALNGSIVEEQRVFLFLLFFFFLHSNDERERESVISPSISSSMQTLVPLARYHLAR